MMLIGKIATVFLMPDFREKEAKYFQWKYRAEFVEFVQKYYRKWLKMTKDMYRNTSKMTQIPLKVAKNAILPNHCWLLIFAILQFHASHSTRRP